MARREVTFQGMTGRDQAVTPGGSHRAWVGAVLALMVLGLVVTADFVLARQYPLIGYYGLAPLVAAATLGPLLTSGVGGVAIGAGFAAAWFDNHTVTSAAIVLHIGVVCSSTVVAVIVAAVRQSREERMAKVTAVAQTAQDAIVSPAAIELAGLEVATAYHSASANAQVGGDFIEGIDSPWGSRLILGDVRGKGLPAVRLAATALGAFRLAALSRPSLEQVAEDLDLVVSALGGDEDFVTAVIAEIDGESLQVLVCGHPAPLIGRAEQLRPLDVEAAHPLGLGGPRQAHVLPWGPGDAFIAYTDGLVEARDPDGRMLSIEQLAGTVDAPRPAAVVQRLVSQVMEHTRGHLGDDLAILAISRADSSLAAPTEFVDLSDPAPLHRRRRFRRPAAHTNGSPPPAPTASVGHGEGSAPGR